MQVKGHDPKKHIDLGPPVIEGIHPGVEAICLVQSNV